MIANEIRRLANAALIGRETKIIIQVAQKSYLSELQARFFNLITNVSVFFQFQIVALKSKFATRLTTVYARYSISLFGQLAIIIIYMCEAM